MQDSHLKSWLALTHLPAMSPIIFHQLIQKFESPDNVLSLKLTELRKCGLPEKLCHGLKAFQRSETSAVHLAIKKDLDWSSQENNHLITYQDDLYPPMLKAIHDPPPLLYVRGDPQSLNSPMLAMVGSRKPTAGGKRTARQFAKQLAQKGLTICSGLAYGIDSVSHEGALDGQGLTVAVLGGGIDRIYPAKNTELANRISEAGALISEFPLGFEPKPWCFPRRNRVVTGLCKGVLVVEAAKKSGSLISAHCALEQGRDVFAIPGSLDNTQAQGCHLLIKQGASLVESAEDVLNELNGFAIQPSLTPPQRDLPLAQKTSNDDSKNGQLSNTHSDQILIHIGHDKVTLDNLIELTGLESALVSALLAELEISGKVRTVSGGFSLA